MAAGYSAGGNNGDFAVVRYNADGTLDEGFGNGGKVITDFGNHTDEAYGITLQGDGKAVVAGYSSGAFALVRYNTNGTLDTSFNGTGRVTTNGGGANSVTMQIDGKIVAAGYFAGMSDFGIVRYNADGTLDTSFNGTGKVTCDFGSPDNEQAHSVLVQSNGKIVVAGDSFITGGTFDIALARLNASGTLDTDFGNGGKVITDFGSSHESGLSAALQANGKVVVAGAYRSAGGGPNDFLVARYNGELLDVTGSGTVNLGSAATFSVVAAGAGTLSYKWKKDGATIPGATASSYTVPNAQPWHIGDYTVEVTDSGGVTASNPALLQITGVPTALWRGLLVYYPCDGNATDREPGSADATVSGAALTTDRLRQSGRAYDFDGVD